MIYSFVIAGGALLAYITEKIRSKKVLFILALLLSLFCGLRGITVGTDTSNYCYYLRYVTTYGISFTKEIGYSICAYLFMSIFSNPHYFLLTMSTITIFLIVYRLWDFHDRASFCLMIVIFEIMYYQYTFNIARQFLAIAIVFWASRYLERNKIKKFIIAVAIAMLFHATAFLGLFFLLFDFSGNSGIRIRPIYILFAFLSLILFSLLEQRLSGYSVYFESKSFVLNEVTVLRMLLLLLVLFSNKLRTNAHFSRSLDGNYIPIEKWIYRLYLVGLTLSCASMFFPFMNRIGFYYCMFEMPFWGQAVKAKKNKGVFISLILALLIFSFINNISGEFDGIMNYVTFLNQQ